MSYEVYEMEVVGNDFLILKLDKCKYVYYLE